MADNWVKPKGPYPIISHVKTLHLMVFIINKLL